MSISIIDAMDDPALFGPWFQRGDWTAWRAFHRALFGLPIGDNGLLIQCAGRSSVPENGFSETWCIVGRRGGKSFNTALIGAVLAAFVDYRPFLQPGERATVMILACDRKQARVIMRYVAAFFTEVPMLAAMVERQTDEQIDLTNRVSIEITTASIRTVRGYTIAAVLADETAFWRSEESANPDSEILNALRPGMATIPGARMICIGSPYARRGEMWSAYRRYHGKDEAPVLVWKAPSRTMNPALPQRVVDEAMARDEAAARAEYLAEFRADIEAFVSREVVERAQRSDPLELPFTRGNAYVAFVDPSGGGPDGFTLAIGHKENRQVVVDAVRERKSMAPGAVVAEYASLLKTYNISRVTGDKYAGSWPEQEFARHGVTYVAANKPKSDLYVDALAVLNSGRVDLPPDPVLLTQFISLERRTSRAGRNSIDHPPGGHDDRANVVAGLIATIGSGSTYTLEFITGPNDRPLPPWLRNHHP
jgi:hypothetical protein